jgi:hypothetical protein
MTLSDFEGREKSGGDFLQAKLSRTGFTSLLKTTNCSNAEHQSCS